MSRNLVLAGNFNLTNVDELFQQLIEIGQHPKEKSDTVTMIEKIGHFLDEENGRLYQKHKESGMDAVEISKTIAEEIDIQRILVDSCKKWDGGYVIAGHADSDAILIKIDNVGNQTYYIVPFFTRLLFAETKHANCSSRLLF